MLGRVLSCFLATAQPELARELTTDGFNFCVEFLYALTCSESGQLHSSGECLGIGSASVISFEVAAKIRVARYVNRWRVA